MKQIQMTTQPVKLRHTLALLLILVFALQLLGCPAAYADGGRDISLLELSGSCSVERGGDTLEAAEGMALLSGDTLVTDEGGSLRLRIDENKFLYLGADCRVQIIAEGTAESSKTVVFVEAGSVMTEVRQTLSETSSFDIVSPNTTMSIHGTKTLTEVIKDVAAETVRTSNAVIEGHVKVKAVKVKADGTVVSVERDLGAGDGNAFTSRKEELISPEEMLSIAGDDVSADNIKVEIVSEEEAGIVFDMATFNATFLESIKNILIADAEEAAEEEGLSQEQIDAINAEIDEIMNSLDVIRENSQNAINKAAAKVEPTKDPIPQTNPEPEPVLVPQTDTEDTQDEGTTLVEGDTNLIDIDDDTDDTDDTVGTVDDDDNDDNDDNDDDDGVADEEDNDTADAFEDGDDDDNDDNDTKDADDTKDAGDTGNAGDPGNAGDARDAGNTGDAGNTVCDRGTVLLSHPISSNIKQ